MRSRSRFVLGTLLLLISACKSSPAEPTIFVSIEPDGAQLGSGDAQQFVPTVNDFNNANDTAVTWSISEGASGGTVDAAGLYTAPVVQSATTFHLLATDVLDTSRYSVVTISVAPLGARIWPLTVTLPSGGTFPFQGSVYNSLYFNPDGPVVAPRYSTAAGSVTQAGVYTAPVAAGTYQVTATSVADPTKTATATVTVLDAAIADREGPLWQVPTTDNANYTINTSTVLDNTTGLLWQRAPSPDATWEDAKAYCAALTFDGQSGWSLPTRIELSTLIDDSEKPSINSAAFPGIGSDPSIHRFFFSSSAVDQVGVAVIDFYSGGSNSFANFNNGGPLSEDYGGTESVLCVHPPARAAMTRFSVTSTTAFDNWTKLTWQLATETQYPSGYDYSDATGICPALPADGAAIWRLPTLLELATLVDDRQPAAPYIDPAVFPGTLSRLYWSSNVDYTFEPQGIYFDSGVSYSGEPELFGNVRCVH